MKTTLQIMQLESCWPIKWHFFLNNEISQKFLDLVNFLKCLPTKNKIE